MNVKKALLWAGAACVGIPLLFMAFLFAYGRADTVTYKEDAAIVFGAGLNGPEPTLSLRRRLEAALAYAERNPNALIVVSGGQGKDEIVSEAAAMSRWLTARGVDPARIVPEDQSVDTRTNTANSKALLDGYFNRPYTVVLITNDFHLFRAERYARLAGLNPTRLHAVTPAGPAIVWYPRECLANLKLLRYVLFNR